VRSPHSDSHSLRITLSAVKPFLDTCVANAAGHAKAGDGRYGYIEGDLIKCHRCGNSLAGSSIVPAGRSKSWQVNCSKWRMDGQKKVEKCNSVGNSLTPTSNWGKAGQSTEALAYAAEVSAAANAIRRTLLAEASTGGGSAASSS
jgi:hypothetical protein